ncbi:MAG: TonB-dependent receptor plug domain-containing protein [Saprospirales bacterium]|nr:TonB-dependent receptor plug domain-containing protein [Saprospirales bacterium]
MNPKFDNFLKTTFTLLIALVFSSFGFSQRTISGMVTDFDTKEPLIGANIRIVGTGSGTITDFDGSYSLSIPAENNAIEVSYTGYSTETIQLGTSNQIDIALKAGAVLEEIVVVGYGTQKTKEVTSAITSIKAEEFNKGNVTNPTQLLQGKVAGLTITQPNNDPNGDLGIALRGISSVSGSTQPLIIIDGVLGADLKSVDPSDIESIDVLKDGSAAAIYGTRGTNGVVIITTKKAVPESPPWNTTASSPPNPFPVRWNSFRLSNTAHTWPITRTKNRTIRAHRPIGSTRSPAPASATTTAFPTRAGATAPPTTRR